MIVHWLVYGALIGALLAAAAWMIERVLRLNGLPTRGVWIVAMLATAALVASGPARSTPGDPAPIPVTATLTPSDHARRSNSNDWLDRLSGEVAAALAPARGALSRFEATLSAPAVQRWNRAVAIAWAGMSGALLLLLAATLRRSARERRGWRGERLHGVAVRVAPTAGPLIVGVLRPEIVVPAWLLHAPAADQRLVLAHEQEHLRSRDPLLLGASVLLAALLPWNPAVWWMAARLRLAVEVDCDRRVLRSGASRAQYGSVLLEVATRRTGVRFPAPALLESSSQLERRLIMMTTRFPRFTPLRSVAYATVAGALVLAACEKALPSAAEIERMDVPAAEAGAQRVGIGTLDGANTSYTIDGRAATVAEAHALDPSKIASVSVNKNADGPTTFAILTPEGAAEHDRPAADDLHKVVVRSVRVGGNISGTSTADPFEGIILIDGVRIEPAAMRDLPADEIASVEILKGAAAAAQISDPAAAKGVIRITTKKAAGAGN